MDEDDFLHKDEIIDILWPNYIPLPPESAEDALDQATQAIDELRGSLEKECREHNALKSYLARLDAGYSR